MQRNYWSDGLTWACNSAMFVFGVVLAVLGALLPILLEETGMAPARAGSLFLFLNLGAFVVTLFGGPSFDRFGFRRILVSCSFVTGAAFLIMAQMPNYGGLSVGAFLLGVGGGGLNAGTNALVSDLYPSSRGAALNRLGIFFGFGALSIPFSVGVLTETLGLQTILYATALVSMIPGCLLLFRKMPGAKHTSGPPFDKVVYCLKSPLVLLFGILLFFHSGNEISTSGWLTTYLVRTLPATPEVASLYLAAFWGSLMVGRLVSAAVLRKVSEAALVQGAALMSACSIGLLIWFPGPKLSGLLTCAAGFFISGIFPSVLGQAASRFPSLSGTVLGVLICIALLGGMLIPWVAGLLVGVLGPAAGLLLPMIGLLVVFLIQTLIRSLYS